MLLSFTVLIFEIFTLLLSFYLSVPQICNSGTLLPFLYGFPYEVALHWPRHYSLARKRSCDDIMGIHQIVHGFLDFAWATVFETSGHSSFTNSGVTLGVANMLSTFE